MFKYFASSIKLESVAIFSTENETLNNVNNPILWDSFTNSDLLVVNIGSFTSHCL